MTTPDFEALRKEFPTLEKLVYLNSGSYGLLHANVRTAFTSYLDERVEHGADWGAWVGQGEFLRAQLATLLNAEADEIAITGSASAGMSAVASALDFGGDRNQIVVSNYEFPTSGQIWHAQELSGASVVHVEENEAGVINADAMVAAINTKTRLVVMSHVCFRHGARFSDDIIRKVVEHAHERGALVLLDCYQSVGTVPIDTKSLGVDFAVGGMLKYLLGTAGIGFLYARRDVAEALSPRATGWFCQQEDNMMNIFAHRPANGARRFQAGTPPLAASYASAAGLSIVLGLSVEAICERIRVVTRYAIEQLTKHDIALATPIDDAARGPMLAIRSTDEVALVDYLMSESIVTSSRAGNVRAGFHFYNNHADVDRLVAALLARPDLWKRGGSCGLNS